MFNEVGIISKKFAPRIFSAAQLWIAGVLFLPAA
jgi:hypothetical protein